MLVFDFLVSKAKERFLERGDPTKPGQAPNKGGLWSDFQVCCWHGADNGRVVMNPKTQIWNLLDMWLTFHSLVAAFWAFCDMRIWGNPTTNLQTSQLRLYTPPSLHSTSQRLRLFRHDPPFSAGSCPKDAVASLFTFCVFHQSTAQRRAARVGVGGDAPFAEDGGAGGSEPAHLRGSGEVGRCASEPTDSFLYLLNYIHTYIYIYIEIP